MTLAINKAKLIKEANPTELALISHSLHLYEFKNSKVTSLRQFDDGTSTMILKVLGVTMKLKFKTRGEPMENPLKEPTGVSGIQFDEKIDRSIWAYGSIKPSLKALNQAVGSFR